MLRTAKSGSSDIFIVWRILEASVSKEVPSIEGEGTSQDEVYSRRTSRNPPTHISPIKRAFRGDENGLCKNCPRWTRSVLVVKHPDVGQNERQDEDNRERTYRRRSCHTPIGLVHAVSTDFWRTPTVLWRCCEVVHSAFLVQDVSSATLQSRPMCGGIGRCCLSDGDDHCGPCHFHGVHFRLQ